jgi:hypothetical protein
LIAMIVVNLILLGIAGLALWKGGRPERYGTIIYGVSWAATLLLSLAMNRHSSLYLYAIFIADFVVAIGFLFVALRFSNTWLALAMIAQGFSSAAHAYRLDDDQVPLIVQGIPVWQAVINIMSLVVIFAILMGTLTTWRRRVVAARGGKPKKNDKLWTKIERPAPVEAAEAT